MDPRDLVVLRERLTRDARALRGEQRCPVDLDPVAERLEIRIEWGSQRVRSGEGALLRGVDGWTAAVTDGDRLRSRARFTVAHELGHYVLESYGLPRPASRRDYWLVESLCHHFAGQLLVPDAAVAWVSDAGRDPVELLRRAQVASQRAQVSPAALSHRVYGELEHCAFCEIRIASPRPGVVGVVDWIVERFPWLGLRARRHVHSDHFLAATLRGVPGVGRGEIARLYLNGLPAASVRRGSRVWVLAVEPTLTEPQPRGSAQLSLALSR